MPSSSSSAGLSSRGAISSALKTSVAIGLLPDVGAASLAWRDRLAPKRTKGAEMAYEVPPLPYDYGALEPHIDEQTMRVHHDKHHQAYVDKANAALEGTDSAHESVEQILTILETFPEDKRSAIRNNA